MIQNAFCDSFHLSAGRVYWCDGDLHTIETSLYDGTDRKVLLRDVKGEFFGIVLDANNIYYSDWWKRYAW